MKRIIVLLAVLMLATTVCACDIGTVELIPTDSPTIIAETATATSEPTATPFSIALDFSATASPTSEPTPTPTLTPVPTFTPEPTEIPFSYYCPTVNMSFEELVGGLDDAYYKSDDEVLWPKGYPAADTYKIIVDLYWQVIMIYSKDDNGEYTVPVRYILCSSGSTSVGSETRQGTWEIQKCRVRFGEFIGQYAAQYWTLIRSRTYFHSILYDKKDLSTYVVSEYNKLGTKCTHGCIRMTVPDARWIWYNISYGTICVIREGSKSDAETQAIREKIILAEPPTTRLSLSPGTAPYTDNWKIEDVDTTVPFINEQPNRPEN